MTLTPTFTHSAVGGPSAVTTADPRATEAAVDILKRGGTAVDALIAAAAVQCVTGAGMLSLTGVWISDAYDAATGETTTVSSKIGPAEAEDYDYEMESPEAYSGRAMPIPGWPAGAHAAWEQGGRLAWAELFEPAISLADGYPLDVNTLMMVRMGPLSGRTAEGRDLFMRDGRYLELGEEFHQPALARTLRALAEGGPEAFYEGEFAQDYVSIAQERGGKITLADLARWRERPEVRPTALVGDYYGHQVVSEGGLLVYALHLMQAAGIDSVDEAEVVYTQVRVLEEVFAAAMGGYSANTHDQFIDREYAESRIDDVLNGPLRPTSFNQFWSNTATLAARDADGNVAWLVHSLNTPNVFGTGIVVGGQFVVRAISKTHARVGDLLAPGLFSKVALCKDGKPYAIAASPGYSCVHAPLQVLAAHVPRGLDALAANAAPRFALPSAATVNLQPFESHYAPSVFKLLEERGVPYMECAPSLGGVTTMVIDDDGVQVVSDVRGRPAAAAF